MTNCQKLVPFLGTTVKNHIQGSFIFCRRLLFLSALNMILHLKIISYIHIKGNRKKRAKGMDTNEP